MLVEFLVGLFSFLSDGSLSSNGADIDRAIVSETPICRLYDGNAEVQQL